MAQTLVHLFVYFYFFDEMKYFLWNLKKKIHQVFNYKIIFRWFELVLKFFFALKNPIDKLT